MDSWISRNVLQGLQDLNYISYTMNFLFGVTSMLSSLAKCLICLYSPLPLGGLSQCYVMCPKIPRHPSKLHLVNNRIAFRKWWYSYQPLDKIRVPVSKLEAWLANMPVCMCLKNYMLEQWKSWSVSEYLYFFNWFVFVWHLTESPNNSLRII